MSWMENQVLFHAHILDFLIKFTATVVVRMHFTVLLGMYGLYRSSICTAQKTQDVQNVAIQSD